MQIYFLAIAVSGLALEAALLIRAKRGRFLSQFPLFYSYIGCVLCGSTITFVVYYAWPAWYAHAFWFYFMITLLAEFAVLLEISDHTFSAYRAIRQLGRLLTIGLCGIFVAGYVLPSLARTRPSSVAIDELVKRSSLAKAVIIVVLLVVARHYRIALGKGASGLMFGFSLYLGINVINFSLAEKYGRGLYARTFEVVGPLSYSLALLVWTIALWRYEPAQAVGHPIPAGEEEIPQALGYQLGKFNAVLLRLLRR